MCLHLKMSIPVQFMPQMFICNKEISHFVTYPQEAEKIKR